MGCIMSKCKQCNVEIVDESLVCPLCNSVLEQQDGSEDKYPDIRFKTRRMMLIVRIYLFVTILTSVLVAGINYATYQGSLWSLIVIAALFYLYLTLRFAVMADTGYKAKIIVLTIVAIGLVILIDFVLGYDGWSVNYVIPGAILLVDAGIVLLMMINWRNWQSYLLFQIFMIGCSTIPLILIMAGIVTQQMLSLIAFGCSVFLFLGTVIIGDRRARVELKRRFHVR